MNACRGMWSTAPAFLSRHMNMLGAFHSRVHPLVPAVLVKNGIGKRNFAAKRKKEVVEFLHQPFDVPANFEHNGEMLTSNVFVLNNIGSKYVMLNRPEALNAINLEMVREL